MTEAKTNGEEDGAQAMTDANNIRRDADSRSRSKRIIPLRVGVMLSIFVLLASLLVAMSVAQYYFVQIETQNSRELLTKQSEAGITAALRMMQAGFTLLQESQQFDLSPSLTTFAHAYDAAVGDLDEVNLDALKAAYGANYDFYIIDADCGAMLETTDATDKGLNFSTTSDFWITLKDKLKPGVVISGPVSQKIRNGALRHYEYLLMPNGRHILEVGIKVAAFELGFDILNYENVAAELVRLDPSLESVRVFQRNGYLDMHPDGQRAEKEVRKHIAEAVKQKRTILVKDETSGKIRRYVFLDLSGENGWPIYKVVEMTYISDPSHSRLDHLVWQQAMIGLVFLCLGLFAAIWLASRITAPLKRIISDVDRIAAGDTEHNISIESKNELRILEESVAYLVTRDRDQFRELEKAEAELSERNTALEKANTGLQREMGVRSAMEAELLKTETILRAFLDADTESAILVDLDGHIVELNRVATERIGVARSKLIGTNINEYVDWETFERCFAASEEIICNKTPKRFEVKDGKRFLDIVLGPVFDRDGEVAYLAVHVSDMTEKNLANAEAQQLSVYFQQLFENSPLAIAIYDAEGFVRGVNRAFEKLFQYESEELMGKVTRGFIVPVDKLDEADAISERQAAGEMVQIETVRKRKDGRLVQVSVLSFPIVIRGKREGVYIIYEDITERKYAEERLVHQTFHDPLTGSPNRALLLDRLHQVIQRMRERRLPLFALLYLDLDRFKVVNDSLGHQVGDQLLFEITRKLQEMVRSTDTVSRIGGDEFAVLLGELDSPREAMAMAQRILEDLNRPIKINEQEIYLSASIGVVVGPVRHERAEFILRDAEIAMYRAKGMGRNRIKLFISDMREQAAEVLRLENDLRKAVEKGEFVLHYQPLINMRTGEVDSFEALLRWQHPLKGMIFPDEFIPVAEDSGLIIPMGIFVLEQACRQVRLWQEQFPQHAALGISVNLSAKQFRQAQLIDHISSTVKASGLEMESVKLEITESVVMENAQSARTMLQRLKSLNLKLSIDDFGTGYSSLSYLRQFPIDTLKIDRSFVMRMDEREEDVEIVRAIISLAHNMKMDVVAEGVENERHVAQLTSMECDFFQGYHFSRPMSAAQAEEYLAAAKDGQVPTNGNT